MFVIRKISLAVYLLTLAVCAQVSSPVLAYTISTAILYNEDRGQVVFVRGDHHTHDNVEDEHLEKYTAMLAKRREQEKNGTQKRPLRVLAETRGELRCTIEEVRNQFARDLKQHQHNVLTRTSLPGKRDIAGKINRLIAQDAVVRAWYDNKDTHLLEKKSPFIFRLKELHPDIFNIDYLRDSWIAHSYLVTLVPMVCMAQLAELKTPDKNFENYESMIDDVSPSYNDLEKSHSDYQTAIEKLGKNFSKIKLSLDEKDESQTILTTLIHDHRRIQESLVKFKNNFTRIFAPALDRDDKGNITPDWTSKPLSLFPYLLYTQGIASCIDNQEIGLLKQACNVTQAYSRFLRQDWKRINFNLKSVECLALNYILENPGVDCDCIMGDLHARNVISWLQKLGYKVLINHPYTRHSSNPKSGRSADFKLMLKTPGQLCAIARSGNKRKQIKKKYVRLFMREKAHAKRQRINKVLVKKKFISGSCFKYTQTYLPKKRKLLFFKKPRAVLLSKKSW